MLCHLKPMNELPFRELLSGLVVLFVLIAFNGFFVASEYSLVLSRRTRIAEMADKGNAAARLVLRVMRDPDRYYAAVQMGITLTSVAIGSFAEEPLTKFFQQLFGLAASPLLSGIALALGSVFGLGLATFFQIVLAELVPRTVVRRLAERVAMVTAPPMNFIATVFTPFIWVLKSASRLVLRLIGIRADADATDQHHSIQELKMLMDESEKGGAIETDQREMLDAVFSFGDTTVREVMMPRTEITCVAVDARLPEVAHILSNHEFTRVPVYENDVDHIVGILHVKDLVRALIPNTRVLTTRQLMREPFFVPDTQRADELLQQFRLTRESLAVVLDEYGGTAGVVTLGDLIEKIIGEITDVSRGEKPSIQLTSDGAVINGLTSIGDVNDEFDLHLSDENYDTLGGFVMGRLGRIPKTGDEVVVPDEAGASLIFRVEEMDKLRVARVRLVRKSADEQSDASQRD